MQCASFRADFGLAVFFEPDAVPRRDLGLEGTPWFMSPEMLSSEVPSLFQIWQAQSLIFALDLSPGSKLH